MDLYRAPTIAIAPGLAAVRAATGDAGAAAGVSARDGYPRRGESGVLLLRGVRAGSTRGALSREETARGRGFNYDDFDDFVGTGSEVRVEVVEEEEGEGRGGRFRGDSLVTDGPPPDLRFGPSDALRSPTPFPNRIEEAKALKAQRAWARGGQEEQGVSSRTSMVGQR